MGTVELAPSREWFARDLPPIDTARRRKVTAALVEIVGAEGPMLAHRAYQLYLRASGAQHLDQRIMMSFNWAMVRAWKRRRLVVIDDDVAMLSDKTFYLRGSEPVVLRERGTRDLEEIPRSEVATLMDQCGWRMLAPEARARHVLETYGLTRLTAAAKSYIDSCASYKWRL